MSKELGMDESQALEALQVMGYVTISILRDNMGWEQPRVSAVIDDLLADSLVWVDSQAAGEPEFWSPTFIRDRDSP